MASLLDMLIFDAVYGSWILSLPLFTLVASSRQIVFDNKLHYKVLVHQFTSFMSHGEWCQFLKHFLWLSLAIKDKKTNKQKELESSNPV